MLSWIKYTHLAIVSLKSINCWRTLPWSELSDGKLNSLPGFKLSDCPSIVGDRIKQRVEWKGAPNLNEVSGNAVRLRFVMRECDLYSFQFCSE